MKNYIDRMVNIIENIKITLKCDIHLIFNNNYLTFDNKIYKQFNEVPIGSPISRLLAELILRTLEADIDNKFDYTHLHGSSDTYTISSSYGNIKKHNLITHVTD